MHSGSSYPKPPRVQLRSFSSHAKAATTTTTTSRVAMISSSSRCYSSTSNNGSMDNDGPLANLPNIDLSTLLKSSSTASNPTPAQEPSMTKQFLRDVKSRIAELNYTPVVISHPSINLNSYMNSLRQSAAFNDSNGTGEVLLERVCGNLDDLKQLTVLANLIYQVHLEEEEDISSSSLEDGQLMGDNLRVAYFLWEFSILKSSEINALYSLAQILTSPSCKFGNVELGAEMYRIASERGHLYATYNLGMLYFTGRFGGVVSSVAGKNNGGDMAQTPNYTKALEHLERASEQGVKHAYLNLGNMYNLGLGMQVPNRKKALEYLAKARDMGDPKAMLVLGNLYASGVTDDKEGGGSNIIIGQDPHMAYKYWYEAAMSGRKDAGVNSKQGDEGAGVNSKQEDEGIMMNDPESASQALYQMGNLYMLGMGISREGCSNSMPDYKMAKEFWDMATETNPRNLLAWFHLGNLYYDGMRNSQGGFDVDYERATWYYTRLIDEASEWGDDGSGVLEMARSMIELCNDSLSTNGSNTPSTNSSSNTLDRIWNDIQTSNRNNSNKPMLNRMMEGSRDDYELKYMNSLRDKQRNEELKYEAMRNHWKYADILGGSSKEEKGGDGRRGEDANDSRCAIM